MKGRVLVIAPHADDEVLGVGGTIARLAAEGSHVYVVIATRGYPPLFSDEFVEKMRGETLEAHRVLGVEETFFLPFPAAGLDTVPHREVNAAISEIMHSLEPDIVFIPFNGDIHLDHQRVFLSSLVASRPNGSAAPTQILAYETLSETNWNAPYLATNFTPNVFVDISGYLEAKIEAMQIFASQIKPFPNERSAEALRALATLRGSTVACHAAESFVLIRQVIVALQHQGPSGHFSHGELGQ